MIQTFLEYLEEQHVDSDMIHQATRYYLAEKYGSMPPSKMRKAMVQAGASEANIDAAQKQLESDSRELDNACLVTLSEGWGQPEDQRRIRNAFAEAKAKLPVIEMAIIAVVAMYGMYLARTGGVLKKSVQRKPDGSYTETTEYHAPTGPLGSLVNLFRVGNGPKVE